MVYLTTWLLVCTLPFVSLTLHAVVLYGYYYTRTGKQTTSGTHHRTHTTTFLQTTPLLA